MNDPLARPWWQRALAAVWRFALVAALAAGAWYGWQRWQGSQQKGAEYATEAVFRAPHLIERTTATGTLQALVTVQVGAQVSGRLVQIYKDFNMTVTAGELIAELDPTLYKSQLEQGRANLLNAQAGVQRAAAAHRAADRTLRRVRQLYDKQLATQADLEQAQAQSELTSADVVASKAQVAQAQAQVRVQETNLTYTKIYSPVDGVVLSRNVDVGQTVAASLQAPVLFQIAKDLGKMQVHTAIDEADIGKLTERMPATFTVDAFRGTTFAGEVTQLRLSPQTVQNVVTYDAVVDVANPGARLRPGMTASVTFETAHRRDVLAVPNAALRYRPAADDKIEGLPTAATATHGSELAAEGRAKWRQRRAEAAGLAAGATGSTAPPVAQPMPSKVYVLRGTSVVLVEVTTGVSDGRSTEILSGNLKVGDQLITRRTDKVSATPGSPAAGPGGRGSSMPRRLF
ncbi:MAG: efflux RND transporter periplasmic adaptor subunit [Deltaproteobacteria bacterium]|nr:efflux RND transporter periplasmic adaptor subunit [Deltaproteobacteria bacterium]